MRLTPSLATLTLAALVATPAAAQTRITRPAPTMQVTDAGPAKELAITALDVEARIVGHLAETSMTMTFFNPHPRALAGDLTFPLPAGSTVSGYGLDVDGVLVDGVVLDKQKARRVFETEVRKGVDPGLVEKVGGAAFRTRVFPIPARGTRTVKVSWISEVHDGSYRLPLGFEGPIRDAHIRVDVVRAEQAPQIVGDGLEGLGFQAWEDRQVAETTLRDAVLDHAITIALPGINDRPIAVERAPDGTVYFAIHDRVAVPSTSARIAPRRVGLVWDASLSRNGDHAREVGLVRAWMDSLGPRRVHVDLTVFADAAAPPVAFALPSDSDALLAALSSTTYDGGTRLASLSALSAATAPDYYLLFSDGISNLGERDAPTFDAPVYALSDADVANHDALRAVALSSGGAWIDLTKATDSEAVDTLGRSPFAFRGAAAMSGLGESYPRIAEPIDGAFSFVGILTASQTSVTLRYDGAGAKPVERVFTADLIDATDGDLLQRFWAQKKVADLSVGGARSEPAMAAVGKQFGIVTPGTSLLVLERLDQYIDHGVRPPASLADYRRDFDRAMADRAATKKVEDEAKVERIVGMWEERVAWWDREFSWNRVSKANEKKGLGMSGSAVGGGGRSSLRRGAMAEAPMAEAAEMESAPDDSGDSDNDRSLEGRQAPAKKAKDEANKAAPTASISLKPWDPATPYIAALKAAAPADRIDVYLAERAEWGTAPAFFLDCADFFAAFDRAGALRILSNIVELDLEDPALLRVYAHRLVQVEELDLAILTFERIRELRAEEPQSHRDLALALAARAEKRAGRTANRGAALSDYQRSLDLLADVVLDEWDRFAEIELIALVELNDVLPKARALGDIRVPVDARLIQQLDMDVRIVMSWDADLTDMDLHVVEPSGEEAYYGHSRTAIGGRVSRDFTQGYGPEEYSIRRAMPGTYELKTKFFGSSAAQLQGAVTLYVDLYTDYGRPNQKKQSITLRLAEQKDTFTVGEITIAPGAGLQITR